MQAAWVYHGNRQLADDISASHVFLTARSFSKVVFGFDVKVKFLCIFNNKDPQPTEQ